MPGTKGEFSILVIEDNQGDFTLVEDFLLEQIEVLTLAHAKSYKEAKGILSRDCDQFDVILLDLSLPDKTGLPLIKDIVELCATTPVIVLTGYADSAFGIKSLSFGVSDYILKDELTSISLYKSILYSSERKKIIAELKESERKYSELFHLSPLPTYVFELASLKFLDVNEAFIKHYGYTRDELSLMNLRDIRPLEEVSAFEKRLLSDGIDHKNNSLGIFKHLKKNGEIIEVEIQSNCIQYKGKNAKVTIATDVTEKLDYIKAMEAQNEKLSEISWIQSHVVRAPLARIMGLIQVINGSKEFDEKEKTLEYILLSANELDTAIRQITDKTKIAEDDKYCKNGLLLQCENNG
ncbi:MAG: domain S-box protein [Mucilaginibacter sp.]|nr:domain S-box protein [Mucilaginibacter sp.]